MSFGLQVNSPSGVKLLDAADSICRFLGALEIPAGSEATGSIHIPGFTTGRPWVIAHRHAGSTNGQYLAATVWASGQYINWDYGYPGTQLSANRCTMRVIYGIY